MLHVSREIGECLLFDLVSNGILSLTTLSSFWFVFPMAIIISTVAMTFGIGSAIFYSPFFLIVLSLNPEVAIALALLVEVFGFGSGVIGYARIKLVNYHLSTRILPFTVIFALIGALIGKSLPSIVLEIALALALFLLAIAFFRKEGKVTYIDHPLHPIKRDYEHKSWLDFWRDFRQKPRLFLTSSLGGLFVGLVSAGLGEVNEYNFVKQLKMNPGLSAGSSVFIVAVAALSASIFNVSYFSIADPEDLILLFGIALFAIPGAVIGGQLGVRVSKRINREKALSVLPILFVIIGILTLLTAIL